MAEISKIKTSVLALGDSHFLQSLMLKMTCRERLDGSGDSNCLPSTILSLLIISHKKK